MQTIPLPELSIVFIPTVFMLFIMYRWKLKAWVGLYANFRMIVQLLLVGYFLTYLFETNKPIIIVALVFLMIGVSTWIALRSFKDQTTKPYLIVLISIGVPGLTLLIIVTQFVMEMSRWFEPNLVIPIAGMIFANSMNTVSLAAERFESELKRGESYISARQTALDATLDTANK